MRPGRGLELFLQDVATMYTLHQLHDHYPEAKQLLVTYVEDGWAIFDYVLPEEIETRRIAQKMELRSACSHLLAQGEFSFAEEPEASEASSSSPAGNEWMAPSR